MELPRLKVWAAWTASSHSPYRYSRQRFRSTERGHDCKSVEVVGITICMHRYYLLIHSETMAHLYLLLPATLDPAPESTTVDQVVVAHRHRREWKPEPGNQ